MTKIYNRITKQTTSVEQYGAQKLKFLYENPFGRVLLKVASGHLYSKLNASYNNSRLSKKKIVPFVEKYKMNISGVDDYNSFAEFFSRKEDRKISDNKDDLISPADAKLLCYKIDDKQLIKIKNTVYSVNDLSGFDTTEYAGGDCLVFRLAMDDYHRYCFIDSGKVLKSKHIKGRLHTVSSISDKYRVFAQNDRIASLLDTDHFGKVIQIEVGAMLVGRIVNYPKKQFRKGDEKGYFMLGGSTVVILLKKGFYIDEDIIEHSQKGIETKVKYGEKIGGKQDV